MNSLSRRQGERSFSLLETVVAVSLLAILMVEVTGVQGNSIAFSDYGRKVLQASYLAKRIMSQVEYQASFRTPLKDLGINEIDRPFEDSPDFTYSLKIEPLPHALDLMFKIFSGGMLGGDDDKENSGADAGAMLEQVKGLIQQSVGDDPIWIAKVVVSWAEGARRNSVDLAMIITDLGKIQTSVGAILDQAQIAPTPQNPATDKPAAPPGGTQPPPVSSTTLPRRRP